MIWICLLTSAIGVAAIACRWRSIHGTTLVAPATWTIISLAIVTWMTILAWRTTWSGIGPSSGAPGYLAAIATVLPPMALFGAKRPQNTAWQFIVATLGVVLMLPAIDHRTLKLPTDDPTLHPAQSIFICILMLMIAVNHLPTRFALANVLFTFAQFTLLLGLFPMPLGLVMCTGAIVLACLPKVRSDNNTRPLDRLWRDFRDAYGVVWGLRIAQRINQSAEMYGWNVRLDWHGFAITDGNLLAPATETAVRDQLKSLLRRFVSPAWIAERLGEPVD